VVGDEVVGVDLGLGAGGQLLCAYAAAALILAAVALIRRDA
jgi:hypothetical protein